MRCIHLGPLALCRRCTATWPLAFGLILAGLSGRLPPAHDLELCAVLGLALGEYAAVHLGKLRYRAWRTWLFGAVLGWGLGRLFHRYLLDPSDPVPWVALLSVGIPGLGAALYHHWRLRPSQGGGT